MIPRSPLRSEALEELVVLGVRPDPKPDPAVGFPVGDGSVILGDARGVHDFARAKALEIEASVTRIRFEEAI